MRNARVEDLAAELSQLKLSELGGLMSLSTPVNPLQTWRSLIFRCDTC